MLAIVLALVAALLFAVANVFQQKGAMEESGEAALKAGFIVRLARKPVWLFGLAADALGFVAQAGALGVGRLVIVEPLLVASVVFALPLGARFTGQRIGRREVVGAALVTAGLAVFTVLTDPAEGKSDAPLGEWLIIGGVFLAIAAVLVLAARGRRPGVKAALFGTASGLLFGLTAGLIKTTLDRFDDGVVAVLADWHLYALIAVSVVAFALTQAALQTGSLAPAIATTMSFETVGGIVLGIAILDEELQDLGSGLVVSLVALVVALAGLLLLAGSEREEKPPAAVQATQPVSP